MSTFRPPFRGKNLDDLFKKVQKGIFNRIPMKYSNNLSNFISECLVVDVRKRSNC
jgi:NIMA (never in mitosis gene a)-related kinase